MTFVYTYKCPVGHLWARQHIDRLVDGGPEQTIEEICPACGCEGHCEKIEVYDEG